MYRSQYDFIERHGHGMVMTNQSARKITGHNATVRTMDFLVFIHGLTNNTHALSDISCWHFQEVVSTIGAFFKIEIFKLQRLVVSTGFFEPATLDAIWVLRGVGRGRNSCLVAFDGYVLAV